MELDLLNLLNIVQINSSIAVDAFSQKYSNFEFELLDSFPPSFSSIYKHDDPIDEYNMFEMIKIYDLKIGLNVLKYFGSYIRKLKVNFLLIASENAQAIGESIAEYCSDSLHQLDLNQLAPNTLVHLIKPFEKVENVTFVINSEELGPGTPQLCYLFPAIRRLTMSVRLRIDAKFIDCELLQLDSLSLKLWHGKNQDNILKMLLKNRHIQNFEFYGVSKGFLRAVNELTPNLQKITLAELIGFEKKEKNKNFWDGIKFRNVKMLIAHQPLNDLSFHNLEELHMHYSADGANKWNEFFRIHQSLKRLVINRSKKWGEKIVLIKFMKYLKKLTEVSIECDLRIKVEDIANFIISHKNLLKFKWTKSSKADKKILRWKFANEWKIIEFEKGLEFKRKREDELEDDLDDEFYEI